MDTNSPQTDNINNINQTDELSDLSQPILATEPETTPQPSATPMVSATEPEPQPPKKKKKSLITAIIILIIFLICGGAFAAFAIIRNQPDNIAKDAIHNLFTAKNVSVDGNVGVSLPPIISVYAGVKSASIVFDAKTANANYATNTTLKIELSDGTAIGLPEIGEIMLDNGNFYLKIDKLNSAYNTYRDLLSSYITSAIKDSASRSYSYSYRSEYATKCAETATELEEISKCYDTDDIVVELPPETAELIESVTTMIMEAVDDIVAYADGKWFEISVEDILNDELLDFLGDSARNQILDAYNCTFDKISNNFEKYSGEFASLYDEYPFVSVAPADDSFYDISFKARELVGYGSSLTKTKLYQDIASCAGTPVSSDYTTDIDDDFVNSVDEAIKNYAPEISAKFEGFLSHHLTELKINKNDEYFGFSSDLKFDYSAKADVSAPSSSTPVMELVHKIYDKAYALSSYF